MNNPTIYRQTDSRWASLPYPTKKSTFGGNGCGACAVLHCIMEMDKYKNWTPKDIQPYMKQHAVAGCGTTWAGIPTAMKHYGLKNVKECANMAAFWKEMAKGNHVAVLLMKKGKCKDGTIWTTGGHYIGAVVDYKVVNNQHYLYIKDSSPRANDGWHCYETSMINHVSHVWVGELDGKLTPPVEKKNYTGQYPGAQVGPNCGTKTNIKYWQNFLNWWSDGEFFKQCGAADGIFGKNTKAWTIKFQKAYKLTQDGIAGKSTLAKAKNVGKKEKH